MKYLILTMLCIGCNVFSNKDQRAINDRNEIANKYLTCYKNYLENVNTTYEYKKVLNDFTDTLNHWMYLKLAVYSQLYDTNWDIEKTVFFNKEKSKALLLVSGIGIDLNDKADFVKIIAAEIIDSSWHFYYKSYPVEYYFREYNQNKAYEKDTIVNKTIVNLCNDGYVNIKDCSMNYEYIDSDIWFQDWMREKHNEFLGNYGN